MKSFPSFLIAVSMYSKIPVPQADWEKSSMEYVMCFFPAVGAVIGAAVYGGYTAAEFLGLSPVFVAALMTALPLWISGGIHMDGYMDTKDALASCAGREKKLEILKDSHTGAFAVMGLGVYLMLSLGAWTGVEKGAGLLCICTGYVMSRALSGLSVLLFPKAKKEGSYVAMFSEKARKKRAAAALGILAAACAAVMVGGSILAERNSGEPWKGAAVGVGAVLMSVLVFARYYAVSRKQFGGITGDLAGYFVQRLELVYLCLAAVVR